MKTGQDACYAKGIALCLASALLFALLGPFGKNAQDAGASTATMLSMRFGIAAVILALVVGLTRRSFPRGRALILAVLLGAGGYCLQSLFYFTALKTLSIGVVSLLLYLFPLIVVAVSVALGRTPPTWTILLATILAVGGVALTMLGGQQRTSIVGMLFGVGAALVYSAYFFGIEALPASADRIAVAAVICASAAISHFVIGSVNGTFDLGTMNLAAWSWTIALSTACTCLPIVLLLSGMTLTKAATASLISCAEPVAAVLIGAAFYGDAFGWPQVVGTIAVVGAVVLLELRGRRAAVSAADSADLAVGPEPVGDSRG